jgi:DNA polymerase III subunit delta
MISFFYGDESYESSRRIKKLKEDFIFHNPESDPIVFDCDEECDMRAIGECINAQGLFSKQKMIVFENFIAQTKVAEQEIICRHLDSGSDDMIVFYEKNTPRKNGRLFKWLVKNAQTVVESQPLSGHVLEKWILATCAERSLSIAQDAMRELILYVGEDLRSLSQEIDKLGCYAIGRKITKKDVEQLVHGRVDADMFATIESIFMRDHGNALTLLKRQIAKGDEGFHIFGMYAYQLRTLLLVSSIIHQENIQDKNVIAKIAKIHPFVAQKSIQLLRRTSEDHLKKLHKKLAMLDQEVKQGKRTIFDALELFIICV